MPADWEPCSRQGSWGCGCAKPLSLHPVVDRSKLQVFSSGVDGGALAPADQVISPAGDEAEAVAERENDFVLPAWLDHVRWVEGSLVRDGSLAIAGDFEYYSQTRINSDYTRKESAFGVFLVELEEAAKAAAIASGMTAAAIGRQTAAGRATMVLRFAAAAQWPALLKVHSPEGEPRVLDLHERHMYASCNGEGAIAQRVVLTRLRAVVANRALAPLGALLAGSRDVTELARELRRVQVLMGVPDPNTVLVRTVEESARRLLQWSDLINSTELAAAPCSERVTLLEGKIKTAPGGGSRLLGLAGPTREPDHFEGGGAGKGPLASRLHPQRLFETLVSRPFIETSTDARALVAAERPSVALQVLLTGRPARAAHSTGGVLVPAKEAHPPQLLNHMILVSRRQVEVTLIDTTLDYVVRARDRVPRYLGEVVAKAMNVQHELSLPELAKSFMESDKWQSQPLDIYNYAWLPALRAEHGEAPIDQVPSSELWADPYQLLLVREIFISTFKAYGLTDTPSSAPQVRPETPQEIIDMVIDVNAVHAVIPSLRVRCGEEARKLLNGVLGVWGLDYSRLLEGRDCVQHVHRARRHRGRDGGREPA